MSGSEAPLASGSLAETPFAHLVLYLYRQSSVGTLHVRAKHSDGALAQARVRVRQGRPVAARSTEGGSDLLGTLLPLCGWENGDFAFYASDNLEQVDAPNEALARVRTVTGSLDPYALLYASLRDYARDDMVEGVLVRYPQARLTLPADRDVGRLGLNDADQAEVAKLRQAPASIEMILNGSVRPAPELRRLVYALLVTHMLTPQGERNRDLYKSQIGELPAPSAPPATSARTAPAQPSTRSLAPAMTSADKPTATTAAKVNEVASAAMPAWQRLISMREGANAGTKDESGRPKAGTSGAPSKLDLPRPSLAPNSSATASLRPPSPMRVSFAGTISDPASKKKRVDQFVQSNRYAEALALLDELVGIEPKNAKLHGLRARALFEVHRGDPGGLPRSVIEAVKIAHELDADESQAYFVKGNIYKHAGELGKAMGCWKRALDGDPKHIDAERELRLARLRRT